MVATFGVEEELLLVDAGGGAPVASGEAVVENALDLLADGPTPFGETAVEHEFKREQAEIGSLPCTTTDELARQLVELRLAVADGAAPTGAAVAAIATSPFKVRPTATKNDRYRRMTGEFGLLARQQLTCGQHVHVRIGSRAEGVGVIDRLAPWLPTLLALSANSPFWQGQDTGYASFRTIMWGLWPTAGPAGPFGDEAGYDAAVADLVRTGAAMDDGMVYFDARLSAKYPTVEIRVADVCTDVQDAVLVAALSRAMVTTAGLAWTAGAPAPAAAPHLQRSATWRAARFGLSDGLVRPAGHDVIPAGEAVQALVDDVRDALEETGDLPFVIDGVQRLLRTGTGADRQRDAYRGSGTLGGVVADVVRRTLA